MSRTICVLVTFLVSSSLAANAFSAEPEKPRAARPIWGVITAASADSVTIAPESAVRRGAPKPAEQTFALSKDGTEFAFAEVGMRRLMADGTTLRTLHDPEPATAADLKAGQLVEVTPGEKAAERIIIAWSVRGTIVKVNDDSIVFRPEVEKGSRQDEADAPEEQTLTIGKDKTRVQIKTLTDERPTGRGFAQTFTYKPGTISDLKADQSAVVCVRNDTAVKITIDDVSRAE